MELSDWVGLVGGLCGVVGSLHTTTKWYLDLRHERILSKNPLQVLLRYNRSLDFVEKFEESGIQRITDTIELEVRNKSSKPVTVNSPYLLCNNDMHFQFKPDGAPSLTLMPLTFNVNHCPVAYLEKRFHEFEQLILQPECNCTLFDGTTRTFRGNSITIRNTDHPDNRREVYSEP